MKQRMALNGVHAVALIRKHLFIKNSVLLVYCCHCEGCSLRLQLQGTHERSVPHPRRKLHPVATPYVFAFYMSSIMALLMSFVITAANAGVTRTT